MKMNAARLSVLDESITNLQTVMLTVTKELEKLEGRREVLKERKRNASQNTEQLKKNIDEASEKGLQIERKWFETKEEVKIKEAEVRRLKQVLKTKRHQLELLDGAIEDTIESKKSDYIDLLNEQASANNEVQYLDQQQNQLKARSTRLDGENEKYIGQRLEITVEIKEKEAELLQVERQIAAQIDQFNKVEKNISSLKKEIRGAGNALSAGNSICSKSKVTQRDPGRNGRRVYWLFSRSTGGIES